MDLQTAARAKGLLDEINKQEEQLKRFVPNHKDFMIYFQRDIPDELNGGIFKVDLKTSLNQDEFDNVIQYIKLMMQTKIDKLKKQLDEL